jgi:signal transduction histidine kinase
MAAPIAKVNRHIPAKELRRRQVSSISKELICLDDLDRLKWEFISTASHELCTPLTSILGFSELLMNPENYGGMDSERQREFQEIIYEKARDLMDIVDALLILALSRSGTGVCLSREAYSIEILVEEALAALPETTDKRRIDVHLVESETSIWIDRKKLGRALTALLANALKFAPDRVIRVRGECSGGRALIAVEDDGIGMSPQDLKRIFQPFFRVDASLTAVAGLGLGLPFARAIVEGHGGELSVRSTPGEGTTFTISIPLTSGSMMYWNH